MESCLKEKAAADLEPDDGAAGCAGAAASSVSEGGAFLTTRRTTFTTFLRAGPCSPSAALSFSLRSGSGLWASPAPLDGGSGLLNRSGTLTGDLILGGEGLRTRAAAAAGNAGRGLLARNKPLPGSNAGTDLAWLDSPLASGCSPQEGNPKQSAISQTEPASFLPQNTQNLVTKPREGHQIETPSERSTRLTHIFGLWLVLVFDLNKSE